MFESNELLKATGGRMLKGPKYIRVPSISIDSRTLKPRQAFIAIKGSNFDGHNFIAEAIKKGAKCIIAQRWPKELSAKEVAYIKVKDGLRALGDIAKYHRNKFAIPLIAVTGSNGKTTTKEMIAWVLSKKFSVLKNEGTKNNPIGLPLTLLNLKKTHDMAVLEIGTNHRGEVEYLARIAWPSIGVITNIGPSHLEFLHSLKNVFQEKYTLIRELKKPYIALLNADDALFKKHLSKKITKPFILSFGIENNSDFMASKVRIKNKKTGFLVNNKYRFILNTPGTCNVYNALIAIGLARFFGMEYKDIISRLARFSFPSGRLRLIELNKIKFLDDTYNSNPLSLNYALSVLSAFRNRGRKIFVMGDMLELGFYGEPFHHEVGRKMRDICDVFIAVGKLSRIAANIARRDGFNIDNIYVCDSSDTAHKVLFNKISPTPDDIILVKGSRSMKMERVFRG